MDARASNGYSNVLYKSYLKRNNPYSAIEENSESVNTSGDMKYLQVINLAAGVTDIATTLTYDQEPYNIYLMNEDGDDITASVTITTLFSGGVYHLSIYSASEILNVKLKIIY